MTVRAVSHASLCVAFFKMSDLSIKVKGEKMIIQNRTFYIAENVTDHYRMKFAKEILKRGGMCAVTEDSEADYEIFDAERAYRQNSRTQKKNGSLRISVNEMMEILDFVPVRTQEFCVSDGVLKAWIPSDTQSYTLNIPNGVKRIEGKAFSPLYPCQKKLYRKTAQNIIKIIFPKSLEVIEPDAFKGFRNLKSIRFNGVPKEISGFRGCSALTEIIIPEGCETVAEHAFDGCVSLSDVLWPSSLKEIGESAFRRTALRSFCSQEALEVIGKTAFAGCRDLRSIVLKSRHLIVERGAFRNCGAVYAALDSESCILKSGSFAGCRKLESVSAISGKIEMVPGVFPEWIMTGALGDLRSENCPQTERQMWTDMICNHTGAFLSGMTPDLIYAYSDLLQELLKDRCPKVCVSGEWQKAEALYRLKLLEKQTGLNPKVRQYYEEGKLYYSYLTGHGFIGSIDTITYDPRYEQIVKEAEDLYEIKVYHCVESALPFASLSLLYVENDLRFLREGRPENGILSAYVHNFELDEGEFGDIMLTSYEGALVRIG